MPAARSFTTRLVDPPGRAHPHTILALVVDGTCPFDDYVDGLKSKDRQKINEYLTERLAKLGPDGFSSKSQFENYRNGLYGLKPDSHRLLLMRAGATNWVIVDVFSKSKVNKSKAQTKRMDAARDTITAFLASLKRPKR